MTLDIDWDETPLAAAPDRQGALRTWQRIMGTEYGGTPGTAGADALEAFIKGTKTYTAAWKTDGPGRAAEAAYIPKRYDWREVSRAKFLHGYDVTRMYPTAAGTTEVSPWSLRHSGPIEFDKALAGWWLIEIPHWAVEYLPDPSGYTTARHGDDAPRWITTPTAKLLMDLEGMGLSTGFRVLDSWTGKGRRIFTEWNQRLELLYGYGGALAATAKDAGRQTLGLLNSPTYSTYRPDWHYTVIAQARANLFRKLLRAFLEERRITLAVDTDCVWYGTDLADPVAAAPSSFKFGDGPGQFKVKGTVTR